MFMFEVNNEKYVIDTKNVEIAKKISTLWNRFNNGVVAIEENTFDKMVKNIKNYNHKIVATAKEGDELAEDETEFTLISSAGGKLVEYCRIKNWGNTPRDINQIRFCHDNIGEFTGSHKCSPHRNKLDVWFYL